MKTITLVGIAIVTVLVGAPAIRTVTAQGKGEDPARQARTRFEEGVRAYEKQSFEAVVSLMTAAIKLDRTERAEGRFGGGYDYFPHFYLGQALRTLGRCGPALTAWEESHRQGVAIKKDRQGDAIQDGYRHCVAQGFLLAAQLNEAHAHLDKTLSDAEATLNALLARTGLTPELQERLRAAQFTVNQARQGWRSALNSRRKQEFDDAQRRADESQRTLGLIQTEALKSTTSSSRGDGAGRSGTPGIESAPITPTPPPIPKDLMDKAEGNLNTRTQQFANIKTDLSKRGPEAASASAADVKIVEAGLEEWRRELNAASNPPDLERYRKAAEVPPAVRNGLNRLRSLLTGSGPLPLSAEFQTGVELFFNGRYEQAVVALTDDVAAQVPEAVKPDFYAVRAAANFALYERSGRAIEREAESRKIMAIEDVRRCKAAKPDFRPRGDAFSPRFIEFFNSIPGLD